MTKTADKKPTMYLVDPQTLACAQAVDRVKKAIATLTKKGGPKDAAEDALNMAMEKYLAEFDPKEVRYCFTSTLAAPRMVLTRTYNAGAPRIDREKLLERGVDPAIIDDATSRTPSEYWRFEELPPEQLETAKEKK